MDMHNTSVIDNIMNGRILPKGNPSLSQENHGKQVVPDHYQWLCETKIALNRCVEHLV